MKRIIIILLIGFLSVLSVPKTEADFIPNIPLLPSPVIAPVKTVKASLSDLIAYNADKYQVDSESISKTIHCESRNNPKAINRNDPNGGSKGIAQFQTKTFYNYAKKINIKNPDIWNTEQQVEVMAYMFSINQQKQWSCARIVGII